MHHLSNIAFILSVTQSLYGSPLTLGYNPDIRPFYAPKPIVYPEPIIRTTASPTQITSNLINGANKPLLSTSDQPTINPNLNDTHPQPTSSVSPLGDRFGQPTQPSGGSQNQGSSGPWYPPTEKDNNPFSGTFLEFIYERTTMKNNVDVQTTSDDKIIFPGEINIALGNKFGSPTMKPTVKTTRQPARLPNLSYESVRPFYAPNPVVYPQPVYNKITNSVGDKQETELTAGSTTVPDLNYVPSRPPFAPNPIEYPQPVDNSNQIDRSTTLAPKVPQPEEGKEEAGSTSGPNKVPNLSYVPSRPPYAPNPVVYPQPVTGLNQNEYTTSTTQKTTQTEEDKQEIGSTSGPDKVPNLSYVPSRPPYAPNPVVYPQPVTGLNQNEYTTSTTQKTTEIEEDKQEIGSTSGPNKVPNLSYVPSRPPYAPNPVVYPQPVTGLNQNEYTTSTTQKTMETEEDKQEIGSTSGPNKVPNLSYVPSRPPYAPNPVVYPQPVTGLNQNEYTTSTTQKVTQSEEDKQEIGSTSSPNKVPNLSYVPSRPPYAPNPVVYPQPVTVTNKPDYITTTTPKTIESDIDNEISSSSDSSTVPNLSYVPSRPPFAPNPAVYPQPTAEKQEETTLNRQSEETTTPGELSYKPTRPFYYPSSEDYPKPVTGVNEEATSTTPSLETTTFNYLADFIHNLELLLEYVQQLQKETNLKKKSVATRQNIDLSKIAAIIKPMFSQTDAKNEE